MRFFDFFLLALILILAWGVQTLARNQRGSNLSYQMNQNYVANLNECRTKTTYHDWLFDVSGITDFAKEKYPNAPRP